MMMMMMNVEILAQSSTAFVLTHIFRALIYWAHRAVILAIAWHLVFKNKDLSFLSKRCSSRDRCRHVVERIIIRNEFSVRSCQVDSFRTSTRHDLLNVPFTQSLS